MLTGKNVVLAVSGSIAAYKIANLASMLKKRNADITVLMTKNAAEVDITAAGVSATDFVFTTAPDDKWHVKEAGKSRLTFNLKAWTIAVEKI